MTTAYFSHPASYGHLTPEGHPERIARLDAVAEAMSAAPFKGLDRRAAPLASLEDLKRAHPEAYIAAIEQSAREAGPRPRRLDADTSVSEGSWEAALRAAGAVTAAVDAVMSGEVDNAFCAMRPPGHHAEPEIPMGFCLFNSIAIGGLYAQAVHGASRVAVVDFDVHHGNGTEAIFRGRPDCLFVSSHQMPLYPGTGAPSSEPNILNMPLKPGTAGDAFRARWEREAFPALDRFQPDLILVSAGFDGHRFDPLANLELDDEDFAWISRQLVAKARELCGGRLVSTLEGGYDLGALRTATSAHVEELMKA